jgi:hypothetical protein
MRISLTFEASNSCYRVVRGLLKGKQSFLELYDENENNIKRFLEKRNDLTPCPFKIGDIDCPNGYITLLPHVHRKDGFFIAKLKRK